MSKPKEKYEFKNVDSLVKGDKIRVNGIWGEIESIHKRNHHPIMLYEFHIRDLFPECLRIPAGWMVKKLVE